jgi:hypothetical protein
MKRVHDAGFEGMHFLHRTLLGTSAFGMHMFDMVEVKLSSRLD